jgi:uncharacterized membrane protein
MDVYTLIKTIHILSATVLFGTGLGTAFHMWRADKTGDVRVIAAAARQTVLADWLFTTPAVIVQPLTGLVLAIETGYSLVEPWILMSVALYILVGVCWLPVVWLQIQMRDVAVAALDNGGDLPPLYRRYARVWFILGWPAFLSVIAIFALMVARPQF